MWLNLSEKHFSYSTADQFRRRDTAQNGMAAFQYDDVSFFLFSFLYSSHKISHNIPI